MIPIFDESGNLPVGMHQATWEEFYERFGYTPHRRKLLGGLELAMCQLRDVGFPIWKANILPESGSDAYHSHRLLRF